MLDVQAPMWLAVPPVEADVRARRAAPRHWGALVTVMHVAGTAAPAWVNGGLVGLACYGLARIIEKLQTLAG
jgi:hypothetical protein